MNTIKFDVALIQDEFFQAKVPALPDLWSSFEHTAEEALNRVKEQIENHLSRRTSRNETIELAPCDHHTLGEVEDSHKDKKMSWHTVEIDASLMFKNSKRERREEHPFTLGFFTPGTEFEFRVGSYSKTEPKVATVRAISKNAPNSFIIHTGVMEMLGESEHERSINISYVTRIIKHVPGRLKFEKGYHEKHRADFFQQEHGRNYDPFLFKHPSQYRTMSLRELVMYVAQDYLKSDQMFDLGLMTSLLIAQGAVKKDYLRVYNSDRALSIFVFVVNKKKFRQAVKRLLNHCLVKVKKEQKAYDDTMEQIYRDDAEADLRREDNDDEDFYSVDKNEFGHPQTFQRDPSGDFPVCSDCHSNVMPNKGQGTICDSCAHEDDSHFEHDRYQGSCYDPDETYPGASISAKLMEEINSDPGQSSV